MGHRCSDIGQRRPRAARAPPAASHRRVAWLTWCAAALVAGAATTPRVREALAVAATHACAALGLDAGAASVDAGRLAAAAALACLGVGALSSVRRMRRRRHAPAADRCARAIAGSLCLAACALLGASWRHEDDESWIALTRQLVPGGEPRLAELEGIALRPPWSDERSHLGDAWGDELSRFTPRSPASTLDMRVSTTHGSAIVRVRVDGHRLSVLAGDTVRALGWVRALGAATNPGGFDGERWSASRRIAAIMDAESPELVVSEGPDPGLHGTLARWRASVEDRLHRSMPAWASHAGRALVGASVIGVSWPGASEANSAFAGTGIQHLVAISGFNMGILAAVVLVPLAALRRPRLEGAALIALAVLFAASIHTEVSAVRAALMAAGAGAVRLLGLPCSGEAVVAGAAIAIVASDAAQAANPGFQLSFAAVIGLMRLSGPLERAMRRTCGGHGIAAVLARKAIPATSASVAAWGATAPITAMHFGQLALWAIPVTIALSPPFAALVVTGSAAPALHELSPPIGAAVGACAAMNAQLLVKLASLASDLPGTMVRSGMGGLRDADPPGAPAALRIDSLDVRDGSCHLIRSPGATILFDAGSVGSATLGSGIVVPALHALGIRRIDAVIVSHANFDHFSAIPEVIEAMRVPRLLLTEESLARARELPRGSFAALLRFADEAGCAVGTVAQGDTLAIAPDMRMDVLWPPRGSGEIPPEARTARGRSMSPNARSVAIVVESHAARGIVARALLCGDLSGHGCDAVSERTSHHAGTIAIAEVPHHGSPDPAAVRMLSALEPKVAIQSTGLRRLQRDAIASLVHFNDPFHDAARAVDAQGNDAGRPPRGPHGSTGRICRLVTARHGAVAAAIGADGSIHAGRFDRDRYVWRTIVPPLTSVDCAHQDERAVEHQHVAESRTLTFADLDGKRSVRTRERWIEPEVERDHGSCRIERRAQELPASLLHDDRGVRPLPKPVTHRELAHQALAPLGDFVDEPYRPPDLHRGEAERGVRVQRDRRARHARRQRHIRCWRGRWRKCRQRHDAQPCRASERGAMQLLG